MKKIQIDTAKPQMPDAKVLMIYTGGTLGMVKRGEDGPLEPLDFSELSDLIPEIWHLNLELEILAYDAPLDSSNIGPKEWIQLARTIHDNYHKYDAFIVLHGTDTMSYSASAISFLLDGIAKPIIFTGAQLPLGFPRTDARSNISSSLEIASTKRDGKPVIREVCIYFNHQLLRGNRSRKIESLHFDAFASENYPPLAKAGVEMEFNFPYLSEGNQADLKVYSSLEERILTHKVVPGRGFENFNKNLTNELPSGVIIETFGSGNVPQDGYFLDFLKHLTENEVPVLNVSQCPGGEIIQGKYQASEILKEIGIISGRDITYEAALTKMMYVLANEEDYEKQCHILQTSIKGEMKG